MARLARNKNGSKTYLKSTGKKGNKKAVSIFYPKNNKKGKVLVTTKKWVTPKQAKQY